MDLYGALTDALDVQERQAGAATSGRWVYSDDIRQSTGEFTANVTRSSWDVAVCFGGPCPPDPTSRGREPVPVDDRERQAQADATYIAAHEPVRTLRRIAAERRVLARHEPQGHRVVGAICGYDWSDGDGWLTSWPCPEVRDLADRLGVEVGQPEPDLAP